MTEIKKRFQTISTNIHNAELKAKRQKNVVQLLAVSKTWPAEKLRELAQLGQRRFGENYLQEALDKITALKDLDLEWHFIGPIQSNKTREIATSFDWAQSIDRLKIANRLNNQRPDNLPPLNVCIQVNIDNEDSKSGVTEDELLPLAHEIAKLDRLKLRGLMIIPARQQDEAAQRMTFQRAYQLHQQLQAEFAGIDTLSMGMTADMDAAIKEGSTMVRIGTALFGPRDTRHGQ